MVRFAENPGGQRGASLVMIAAISVIAALLMVATLTVQRLAAHKAENRRCGTALLNICEAGKEDALARLRSGGELPPQGVRSGLVPSTTFAEGEYSVACSLDAGRAWLWSTGELNGRSKIIEVEVSTANAVFNPKWVKGALTVGRGVKAGGGVSIDGSDWLPDGSAMTGGGILGIWSCAEVSASPGGAQVWAASGPAVEANAGCDEYPATPEAALGLTEGSLDRFKVSPGEFNARVFPFSGIVYVTGSCGPVLLSSSSGVLIVHNASSPAKLSVNQGDFRGVIVCDELDEVRGAFR
jgi:hypothetical protein